ncbi:MAG: glycosyltransferase family 2 protein [bacterium]
MKELATPQMSVILVTPDHYATISETITYLRKQSAVNQLELVIVASSAEVLQQHKSELKNFRNVVVVEVGDIQSIARANAAGIRQATAPVVVLAEDHSFPDPSWAEALIKAHRQSWAAVGPVIKNANPATAVSWADFLIGYGPWLDPTPEGPVEFLPGHNSSYKRARLLEYGAELEAMMEAETVLHWDLRKKGHQLYLEPAAKTAHVNFSLFSSWVKAQYHCGRVFAGTRIKTMSVLQRLLYIGGAPLIPFVRLWRILKEMRRPGRPQITLFRVLPVLFLGLTLDGLGQMIGYALGIGSSKVRLTNFEFHRRQHLSKRDGQTVAG